jgi:3-(3-hydroxy-phenyl)propionate hydroxylase
MMPTSNRQAAMVQNAFRVASLVPPVQAYFAQMKYKPKPYYHEGFLAKDGGLALSGRMLPQPWLELRDRSKMRLDAAAGAGFALVAIGEDAQALAAATDVGAIGLGPMPRIAITPQKIALDQAVHEGVVEARDVDGVLGAVTTRAKNVLVLMRPDRYVAVAMKIEKAQTPGSFVEEAKRLTGMVRG